MNASPFKSVLVTGATGFVGSRLARALVEGTKVHILVRPDSNPEQLAPVLDKLIVHRWDGSMSGLQHIMTAARPEVVFHIASLFLAAHKPDDVPRLIQSNVQFGAMLLEAAIQNGISRFVNAGTGWQHFENAAYRPVNLYAATKQAFEDILAYYTDAHGLRAISLKLFDTYGPQDPRPKLIPVLLKTAREIAAGRPAQELAMAPGDQILDFAYIDDVTAAFIQAAHRTAAMKGGHEAYGVSGGERMSLKELVAAMEKALNLKLPTKFGARPYREREVMQPWTSHATLPGWSPKVLFAEGIRKSFMS